MSSIKAKLAALRAKRADKAPKKVDAELLAAAEAVGSPRVTWDGELEEGVGSDGGSLSSDDESDCLVVLAPPVRKLHPVAQRRVWRMREAERARCKAARELAGTGIADFQEGDVDVAVGGLEEGGGDGGDVEEALLLKEVGSDGGEVEEGGVGLIEDSPVTCEDEADGGKEGGGDGIVGEKCAEGMKEEGRDVADGNGGAEGRERSLRRLAGLGGIVEDEAEDEDGEGEGSETSRQDEETGSIICENEVEVGEGDKKKLATFHREWEMDVEKGRLGVSEGHVDVDCAMDLGELREGKEEVAVDEGWVVSEADEGVVGGERERAESYMDSMFLRDESRRMYAGEVGDEGQDGHREKAKALWKARQKAKEVAGRGVNLCGMDEGGGGGRGREGRVGIRRGRRRGIGVGKWSFASYGEVEKVGGGMKNGCVSVGSSFVGRRKRGRAGVEEEWTGGGGEGKRVRGERSILKILGERAEKA